MSWLKIVRNQGRSLGISSGGGARFSPTIQNFHPRNFTKFGKFCPPPPIPPPPAGYGPGNTYITQIYNSKFKTM